MRNFWFSVVIGFALIFTGQQVLPWMYDLGFESIPVGKQLPDYMNAWGTGFEAEIQDTYLKEGKQALLITKLDPTTRASIVVEIPYVFKAKTIEITAYIKTEDIKQGYASLFVQMDGGGKTFLLRPNINNISGTTDWKLYSSGNIAISSKVDKLYVGVTMTGTGKMWVDKMDIKLDGKPLAQAPVNTKKIKPADLDTAFMHRTPVPSFALNDTLKQDLLLLSKIWGFVKYYHPAARAGQFNMDNELLRFLPSYVFKTHRQRIDTLEVWLQHFGQIEKKGKGLKISKKSIVIPSYTWIQDTLHLGKKLSLQLQAILRAKRSAQNYYVDFNKDGQPVFLHERSYDQASLDDQGMMLLTLFKIHAWLTYFYPYASTLKETPDDVFLHFLPYLSEARDENTVRYYLLEISAKFNDSQVELLDKKDFYSIFWGKNQANYILQMIDGQPVIAGYIDPNKDDKTGLRVGDVIRDVNGQLPRILYNDYKKYIAASNDAYYNYQLVSQLLRTNNNNLNITVTRERKLISRSVPCYPRSTLALQRFMNSDIPAWRFITPEIGYVDLTLLKPADVPVAMKDLYLSVGLVLDARNLESDVLLSLLLPYFASKQDVYARETRNDPLFLGHFKMEVQKKVPSSVKTPYQKRVVVLVNEGTKGGGERLVMALRACKQVTIVGNTTAGSPSLTSTLPLPGGIKLRFSSVGVYWPDGKLAHGEGIRIDNKVSPTLEGLVDRRDEMLEKAAKIIQPKQ